MEDAGERKAEEGEKRKPQFVGWVVLVVLLLFVLFVCYVILGPAIGNVYQSIATATPTARTFQGDGLALTYPSSCSDEE